MDCGVYIIRNTVTRKYYLGSTVNLIARWNLHRHELRNNKHHSRKLQNSWNKHGESKFVFAVVKRTVTLEDARKLEQSYLDKYQPHVHGYNGMGQTVRTEMTAETRKKISDRHCQSPALIAHCRRLAEARRGKHWSQEVKDKLSATHKKLVKPWLLATMYKPGPKFTGKIRKDKS